MSKHGDDNAEQQEPKQKPNRGQPRLTRRGEYTLFEHPDNLCEVEFPSDWEWEIDEEDGRTTQFRPKGTKNVTITVYSMPYSIDTELITSSPKANEFFEKLFVQLEAKNPRRDSTFPYFSMRADREREKDGGSVWLIAACDLILGVTAYHPHGEQHLWESTFDRILSTFRVPRELEALMTRAEYRLCEKVCEQWPEEDFKIADNELKGKQRRIPLGNLLYTIRQRPRDWERIVDEFFEQAVTVMSTDNLGKEELPDCRDKIYPFIRRDTFAGTRAAVVQSDWLADLRISYVINIPSGFRYITQHDIKRWGIDADELHEVAMKNLTALPFPEEPQQIVPGNMPIVFIRTGDNMEASRLLMPGFYERFAEILHGPFIAAIPGRDSLILIPNDVEMRRDFQEVVRQDFKESSYAITDRLFLVTPDGIALAEW